MGSPLPEDPYLALGVPKDATPAIIKKQYRMLVLKSHPDKIQDEALKAAASERFHMIQTAYEIIGDEEKRRAYDAQVKLAELKREVMERKGSAGVRTAEVRTGPAYGVPTDAARTGGAFYPRGPDRNVKVTPQYEERKPTFAHQNAADYFDTPPRAAARKEPEYERPNKRSAPREPERPKAFTRESRDSERARQKERSRRTDRDIRRDRDRKAYIEVEEQESDSDEYERQNRKMRAEDAELRKARAGYHAQSQRDKDDAMRGYYDGEERARKTFNQYDEAREYMNRHKRRPESERRPSPARVTSKTKVETKKTETPRGFMMRRGSSKPKPIERRTERDADRRERELPRRSR
jgi:curved DNA-binding protein CbpA